MTPVKLAKNRERKYLFANEVGQRILDRLSREDGVKSVGIIGSRAATPLGLEWAHRISYCAAREGIIVISGGARGIDQQAHLSAIDSGTDTLAILGSGLGKMGRSQRKLDQRGIGLASPFDHLQSPRKWTFPKRNLDIAALSSVIIVIQASEESGALITAREALRLQKEVWVLSHLPTENVHRGCLHLLNEGAKPLLDESSWLVSLSISQRSKLSHKGDSQRTVSEILEMKSEPTSLLWKHTSDTPRSLEWLADQASLSYEQATLEAAMLELEGWLIADIGVGYRRGNPR